MAAVTVGDISHSQEAICDFWRQKDYTVSSPSHLGPYLCIGGLY